MEPSATWNLKKRYQTINTIRAVVKKREWSSNEGAVGESEAEGEKDRRRESLRREVGYRSAKKGRFPNQLTSVAHAFCARSFVPD